MEHAMISNRTQYRIIERELLTALWAQDPYDRGEVHAQKTSTLEMMTRELRHQTLIFNLPALVTPWQVMAEPNLSWAEDHFRERVSGEPLNPPPSNEWWPFARKENAEHKDTEGKFSHSYPERFWPRFANEGNKTSRGRQIFVPHVGLRFEYGDLNDLVGILRKNPRTRQAYLPVWFPEDLAAAAGNERVPCTLGYHFMSVPDRGGKDVLDCTYYMRSCDIVRFFRDDVYMAGRLLQWVSSRVDILPGTLRIHISSLHCFQGDMAWVERRRLELDPDDEGWGVFA
jgi:hypothetical protein